MTETLYSVLGIEPTATEAEIKGAWRSLVSVLGPTDHRFAAINDAASVLLDPNKRAAYDGTLVQEVAEPEETEPAAAQEPVAETVAAPVTGLEESSREATEETITVAASSGSPSSEPSTVRVRLGSLAERLSAPLIAGVTAAVAVALIVATSITYLLHDDAASGRGDVTTRTVTINLTDTNVKPIQQTVSTRETADITAAVAAAAAATPKILDYDYRTLGTWQQNAAPYMTADLMKKYVPYFNGVVVPNVKRVHGTVTVSSIIDSGVVMTAPGLVQVLVLFDTQTSTATQSVVGQMFAALTMVQSGGQWLVSKVDFTPIAK